MQFLIESSSPQLRISLKSNSVCSNIQIVSAVCVFTSFPCVAIPSNITHTNPKQSILVYRPVPPPIIWAQRSDVLFVTVAVEVKDEKFEFTEDTMHFSATAVNIDRTYDVTLNFLHKIVPDQVTTKKTAQCSIQFTIPRVSFLF